MELFMKKKCVPTKFWSFFLMSDLSEIYVFSLCEHEPRLRNALLKFIRKKLRDEDFFRKKLGGEDFYY